MSVQKTMSLLPELWWKDTISLTPSKSCRVRSVHSLWYNDISLRPAGLQVDHKSSRSATAHNKLSNSMALL
jgi:hypothetical protein